MTLRAGWMTAVCVVLAGCVAPPTGEPTRRPAAPAAAPAAPSAPVPTEALEARHYERAQAYTREGRWADALVEWELLTLISPESREYRDALAQTRVRIRNIADGHARAAEQARRQGNLDQAVLMYLRVLAVDRDNTAAAQALRDIDAERTKRSYVNRPPRMAM